MKNKKTILLIAIALILLLTLIYFNTRRETTNDKTNQPVIQFDEDQILRYSPDGSNLEIKDDNDYRYLSKLPLDNNRTIINVNLSPNQNLLLYSSIKEYGENEVIDVDENNESQTLHLKQIGEDQQSTQMILDTYSAKWLSEDEIIYQDIETDELVIYSLRDKQEVYRKDFDLINMTNLYPLTDSEIIAVPYSYDVSDLQAEFINLEKNSKSDYLSGNGLEIKTILNTPYLYYSTIEGTTRTATVVEWKTGKTIYTTTDSNFYTWDEEGSLYRVDQEEQMSKVEI